MPLKIDISELKVPMLEFGTDGDYSDPRIGLYRAGPYSLRFGVSHKTQVRLGIVAPSSMIPAAQAWLSRCQGRILPEKINPMYIEFPGFENAFQSALVTDRSWIENIDQALDRAMEGHGIQRFDSTVHAYADAVGRLSKTHRIDLIMCCVPPEVIATCRTVSRTLTPIERARIRSEKLREDTGQLLLYDIWKVDSDPEELLQRDFRRALKAIVMQHRIPIQIATNTLFLDELANQDAATRAWNSMVAVFYKAGGLPWRLKLEGPETCFVGLSFHHLRTSRRHLMYSSVAQAFSAEVDGFALRGDTIDPPDSATGRRPHLSVEQASRLGKRLIEEYRERTGRNPVRIVLHKTTMFDDSERNGFLQAFNMIPVTQFVHVAPSDFRLVQRSAYPPKRGTLCQVNGASFLFTTGFIPEWNTYPGMHVPAPIRIRTDRNVDVVRSSVELLGLMRMNWNTAFDTSGVPITLRFAREVGGIMTELLDKEPEPSYRFYM
jgi:hypothetical protein